MSLEYVLKRLGFTFDPEIGIFVNKSTHIPITVFYDEDKSCIVLLDQTKLPYEVTTWRSDDWREVAFKGIKGMIIRGSQAIGCAAGYAMLLAALSLKDTPLKEFLNKLQDAAKTIRIVRPTAYPLMWAVDLTLEAARKAIKDGKSIDEVIGALKNTADYILASDLVMSWFLRQEGMKYLQNGDVIMTHCNGGSLSSSYGGHALGMIEEAYAKGMDLKVVAKETRPRCQGYRLTVWELNQVGIPTIIVTDNMITSSFQRFKVSKVILGVDRVAKDGSVANKIGSVDIAYIARNFNVPFYYATSYSTIDLETEEGEDIPIEERERDEVTGFYSLEAKELKRIGKISKNALDHWPSPNMLSDKLEKGKVLIYNPAFDVTPPDLIDFIITDIGSFKPEEIKFLTKEEIDKRVKERLMEWGLS